jgi:hypothetical protein
MHHGRAGGLGDEAMDAISVCTVLFDVAGVAVSR